MEIKAIFHIDEIDKWKLVIGNVNNLCDGIDMNHSHIEILANSSSVKMLVLRETIFKSELEALFNRNVKIVACNNSLKGLNISKSDLLNIVEIALIGVKELIEKQSDGFAYIKP